MRLQQDWKDLLKQNNKNLKSPIIIMKKRKINLSKDMLNQIIRSEKNIKKGKTKEFKY
jgi:hypothetical protein